MTKVRYDVIYFYDTEIDNFLEELDFTYDMYNAKIKNIFESPETEAKKYEIYLQNNMSELNSFYPDQAESEIYERAGIRYFQVKNLKYRNLVCYINLTYQMLEQFIISIIIHNLKFIINDSNLKKQIDINRIDYMNFFEKFDFDVKKLNAYNKINEMRILQNVLKHGEGNAMKKLKEIRPDFFESQKNRTPLYMVNNTIIDDTLNITEDDFEEYINSIKLFLKQFPDKIVHKYELEV